MNALKYINLYELSYSRLEHFNDLAKKSNNIQTYKRNVCSKTKTIKSNID